MQYDMCTPEEGYAYVGYLHVVQCTYIARLVHNTTLHYSVHADTHLLGSKVSKMALLNQIITVLTLPLYLKCPLLN